MLRQWRTIRFRNAENARLRILPQIEKPREEASKERASDFVSSDYGSDRGSSPEVYLAFRHCTLSDENTGSSERGNEPARAGLQDEAGNQPCGNKSSA